MRVVLWSSYGVVRLIRTLVLVFVAILVSLCLWSSAISTGLTGVDLNQDDEIRRICSRHGWTPYRSIIHEDDDPDHPPQRKIYDLCMVNNELDWLEIRLNTTYDDVDYFVIVEGTRTFTGLEKPLVIHDNWDRFQPYHAKMLYHELAYPDDFQPERAWDREDLQRNAMFLQVLADEASLKQKNPAAVPAPGDVLLVADVDEIPRPETLRAMRLCQFPRRLTLESNFYYYSYQFRSLGAPWAHPQATFYQGPRNTILPVDLRNGDGGSISDHTPSWLLLGLRPGLIIARLIRIFEKGIMPNAAWHCSTCFATMNELLHKLESVSHTWMNEDIFRDRDRAAEHVRNGQDLWDRPSEQYERIENNADIPSILLEQPERFRYLLNRNGESAGFSDYPN